MDSWTRSNSKTRPGEAGPGQPFEMYNPVKIKGFSPKRFYVSNAITRADLSYGSVPGPRAQMLRLLFVFTYILQEDVVKIFKVLGATRNVNSAGAITSLAIVTIYYTIFQ